MQSILKQFAKAFRSRDSKTPELTPAAINHRRSKAASTKTVYAVAVSNTAHFNYAHRENKHMYNGGW